MDFFERQDRAHRNTKLLVLYFAAGVALLTVAIYFVVFFLFAATARHHHVFVNEPAVIAFWNPKLFAGVALCTLLVITFGCLSKTLELNQGGSVVATTLGGRVINPTSSDPDERKLLNEVEEMAIASGIPVPEVY